MDGLEIDLAARLVRRDGTEVHLTPIEFKLLRALLHGQGRPISHETLLAQVWGTGYASERPVLRAHIANLRRKLEDERRLIRTVHGIGYRLLGGDRSVRGPATDGQAADCTRTVVARV
jgi:two-component system KDP operon response regulator KdpE